MATVVPSVDCLIDFVCLVYRVDCLLHIPKTKKIVRAVKMWGMEETLLVNGNILSDPTEFALESDARGVEWAGLD